MCSVWQCHFCGTGVCYSATDMVEGNLTAFTGCPTSDALEGVASPSPRRAMISSGLYEVELAWTFSCITRKEQAMQGSRKWSDSRFAIPTERTFPYLETSGRVLDYSDPRYLLNTSRGPDFLVASRHNLRSRFRPGPFDPSNPIRLVGVPWALVGIPSPRQGHRPRVDFTAEGEERD